MDEDVRLAALELLLRELMTELKRAKLLSEVAMDQVRGRAMADAARMFDRAAPRGEAQAEAVRRRIGMLMVNIASHPADRRPRRDARD